MNLRLLTPQLLSPVTDARFDPAWSNAPAEMGTDPLIIITLQAAAKEKAKSWARETKEDLRDRVGDPGSVHYTAVNA
jgi:hypothetical protein